MLRVSTRVFARVSGVVWNPVKKVSLPRSKEEREATSINIPGGDDDQQHNARVRLSNLMAETDFLGDDNRPAKKLVDLPGVVFKSDLPADPITRLFFQQKGEYALYQGTYLNPEAKDSDRVEIRRRETDPKYIKNIKLTPVYDFCHRIREAFQQKKRFVIVPSTPDTKGCAQVMFDHGLIAGFRDFHNDRAFAVELKYFQNESTITYIAPASSDGKQEFEWSPKMMRRFQNSYGIHNRITVFVCRTADGRVVDHITASREQIGGRGLMMVC